MKIEWISVKIEPEYGGEYLVCSKDNCYALATLIEEGWFPFVGPDFKTINFEVTYWMPLPEPPKQ